MDESGRSKSWTENLRQPESWPENVRRTESWPEDVRRPESWTGDVGRSTSWTKDVRRPEEVGRSKSWTEELASLVEDTGIRYTGDDDTVSGVSTTPFDLKAVLEGDKVESESLKDQMKGFAKAWGEIVVELGKGCKDVVVQSVLTDDSYVVKKVRGPCRVVVGRLSVLNEFLPEDRDPVIAWPVILSVFLITLSVD